MSSFPAGLTPADVPLHWSITTTAGQLQVSGLQLQLTLSPDWQGVRPAGALASWLSESGAQSLHLDEPSGVVRFADATVAAAAHRGQLLSWWLSAISAGDDVWSGIGRMASVWATVGFPAADAHAWIEGTGLVVWKTAVAHSAVAFVRPQYGASPMPALRCVFQDQPDASAHRQALRSGLPLTADPALDAAAGWSALGWHAWLVAPGVSPGQIAAGIQLAASLVKRAPTLAALLAAADSPATTPSAPPSPFEALGGAPALGPAPAVVIPRTEPAVVSHDSGSFSAVPDAATAVEPPAEPTAEHFAEPTTEPTTEPTAEPAAEPTVEQNAEPASEPATEQNVESAAETSSDEPALLLERPRVNIPVPDDAPELPEATSSDRFDLWLVEVAADPERTVELLARSLRLDRAAAAELCGQAPVIVARNIAAWEVRKLDAVVRLGGGGRLRWDRVQTP